MKTTTSTDQSECVTVLGALGLKPHLIRPLPPNTTFDGISPMGGGTWLIITYDIDTGFTVHFLEDATHDEAWAFFHEIHGAHTLRNVRAVFSEAETAVNSHN